VWCSVSNGIPRFLLTRCINSRRFLNSHIFLPPGTVLDFNENDGLATQRAGSSSWVLTGTTSPTSSHGTLGQGRNCERPHPTYTLVPCPLCSPLFPLTDLPAMSTVTFLSTYPSSHGPGCTSGVVDTFRFVTVCDEHESGYGLGEAQYPIGTLYSLAVTAMLRAQNVRRSATRPISTLKGAWQRGCASTFHLTVTIPKGLSSEGLRSGLQRWRRSGGSRDQKPVLSASLARN